MNDRAVIRDDFIRRLFAVAISIGFATTLIQMKWVKNATLPNQAEWDQIAILITGLFLTVLSWDGYLLSIKGKPLNGYFRFVIDIVLVFIYMFFLISSNQPDFWLPILVLVFVLYTIWDALTVREHMGKYDSALLPSGADESYRAKWVDVARVYKRGFLDQPSSGRGPIVTISWTVYFAALAVLNQASANFQVPAMCAFAIAGLILYRQDKVAKPSSGATVPGLPMWLRAGTIVLLLSLAAVYLCYFRVIPTP